MVDAVGVPGNSWKSGAWRPLLVVARVARLDVDDAALLTAAAVALAGLLVHVLTAWP